MPAARRTLRDRRPRRQLAGAEAVLAALEAGEPLLRLLLVRRGHLSEAAREAVAQARRRGIAVRTTTANDLRRMSAVAEESELLALVGADPRAAPDEVLAAGGAVWLLVGVAYPGNAGFAIRCAEVSGAAGIFLDTDFEARGRRQALRASMHAERFLPVHWMNARDVIEGARRAGRTVIAVENLPGPAPWELDLRHPSLFVVGGEGAGIPPDLLRLCHRTVCVPMAGFIPSYNLQAAMAAVAFERLRQLAVGGRPGRRTRPRG